MARNKKRRGPQRQAPKMSKPKLRIVTGSRRDPPLSSQQKRYFTDLHRVIDQIFEEAANEYEWTWNQLATHADLTYLTVSNLGERVTQFPRYQTIYKLCKALGWSLITQADVRKSSASGKMKVVG